MPKTGARNRAACTRRRPRSCCTSSSGVVRILKDLDRFYTADEEIASVARLLSHLFVLADGPQFPLLLRVTVRRRPKRKPLKGRDSRVRRSRASGQQIA